MSEQSASQILGRHCSSAGDEVVALGGSGCKYKAGEGRMQLSSKSIKNPRSSTCDVAASLVFLEESRSKRTAGVLFKVYEQGEVGGGMFSSEKKSSGGESNHGAASTSGMAIDFGLSEMDAKVSQGLSAGRFGAPTPCDATWGFELPSKQEMVSGEKTFKRSKYCPRESAKTLLKDFFELYPPTILNPEHATASLGAHQMIQFARVIVL